LQTSGDKTTTLGLAVLKNFDVYANENWYWIGAGALAVLIVFYNVLFTLALMYLSRKTSHSHQSFYFLSFFLSGEFLLSLSFCLNKTFYFVY